MGPEVLQGAPWAHWDPRVRGAERPGTIGTTMDRLRPLPALATIAIAICGCKYGRVTTPDGAAVPWAQMDHAARHAHMQSVVLPRMRTVFQRFDSERFADFGCGTCHGDGMADGTYAMPNPNLPTLDHAGVYKTHRKESPEITRFMWKEVQSELGQSLGVTWGPNGTIDCKSCHPVVD